MSETRTATTEAQFLEDIFKNVKMGADSIVNLMNRVKDETLKLEMTYELDRYEEFARRASTLMTERGLKAKEENPITKASAKIGMAMNTITDSTTPHLAEMLIQGSVMGVTDLLKQISVAEECGIDGDAMQLAREAVDFEEDSTERLKKFL
ncbi:MAG: hypothetical protein MJ102_04275 [Clostridia bacterium]|nr:hypothetical protein [Clostridia bacterium]